MDMTQARLMPKGLQKLYDADFINILIVMYLFNLASLMALYSKKGEKTADTTKSISIHNLTKALSSATETKLNEQNYVNILIFFNSTKVRNAAEAGTSPFLAQGQGRGRERGQQGQRLRARTESPRRPHMPERPRATSCSRPTDRHRGTPQSGRQREGRVLQSTPAVRVDGPWCWGVGKGHLAASP